MLVLTRKRGEKIIIGEDIELTVLRITDGSVRLGIEAPRLTPVVRSELRDRRPVLPKKPDLPKKTVLLCPKCGGVLPVESLRPNGCVWCDTCGGLVPRDYKASEEEPPFDDPVRSAAYKERRRHER